MALVHFTGRGNDLQAVEKQDETSEAPDSEYLAHRSPTWLIDCISNLG